MWYAKMYFSGEKEFFENDALNAGLPSKQLELPVLESLLTFLELDEEITPIKLERTSVNWERLLRAAPVKRIQPRWWSSVCWPRSTFIFAFYIRAQLRLFFRKWLRSSGNSGDCFGLSAEFVTQFSETRKQVEKFFECVLDVDSGREPQKQAAKKLSSRPAGDRSCSSSSRSAWALSRSNRAAARSCFVFARRARTID